MTCELTLARYHNDSTLRIEWLAKTVSLHHSCREGNQITDPNQPGHEWKADEQDQPCGNETEEQKQNASDHTDLGPDETDPSECWLDTQLATVPV